MAELLAAAEVSERLDEAELLELAKEIPRDTRAEFIVWEEHCGGRPTEMVLGLFSAQSGRVVVVRGREMAYVRVRISSGRLWSPSQEAGVSGLV
jgi:hypothetical protein